jgi:uncharacterized protein YbjT (DUF2867 family)
MILVVGGTGRVGRQIVELLRRDRLPVRVLTRDPAHVPLRPAGVEVARGDLRRPRSLTGALAGVDTIVCSAHGGEGRAGNGPRGIEGTALPHLVGLAGALPIRQFVYLSSASARPDSPAELFRLKAAMEQRLRASGVPHIILRPTHLMDTWIAMLGKPLATRSRALVIGRGQNPVPFVAGRDVARAAARLATEPGTGLTVDLGGPEMLSLLDVNRILAASLGVTVARTIRMPLGSLRAGGVLLRPFHEVLSRQLKLGALLDTLPQAVDSGPAWRQLGITPRTLTDWLHDNLSTLLAEWNRPARRWRYR